MTALAGGAGAARRAGFLGMVLTLYVSFVFVQSLFFKFADAPETLFIFGTLDAWAAGFGLGGIFAPGGLFSARMIGTAELVASALLIAGLFRPLRVLRFAGGLFATAIMSGAILFHLVTPLGVEVDGDGGLLFAMACGVWLSGLVLAWTALPDAMPVIRRLRGGGGRG
jgi:hypothetical protein